MSTAEELLASAHTHPVPDTDTYFIIDPITRRIENTNAKKSVIMQYDHNSERFTFQLPRYVDGHDMLECTSITVNADNIEAETGTTNSDAPDMIDLRSNPDDPETVISSWSISRNLTQLAGILSFSIEYKCVDSEGNVVYEWSTDTYDEIEVKARKKNGEAAVSEYTDVLEQWRTKIFGAGDSVMANITAEGNAQVAAVTSEGTTQVSAVKAESETQQEAVELKGVEALESIPEDYTETNNMADKAIRSKGDAVVCDASGEAIALKDSSDDHLRGLKVFGKSSQVTTKGYQLFDARKIENASSDSVTLTNNGDGSFTVTGTVMGASGINVKYTSTDIVKKLKVGKIYLNTGNILTYIYVNMLDANRNIIITLGSAEGYLQEADITESKLSQISSVTFGFYGQANKAITNGTIKPMVYQDGDGTWEPFTGGIPAPNPDYPQEIESIENPTVNVYSKNFLVNQYPDVHTIYGVTFTKLSDGGIHIKGTPTAAIYYNLDFYTNRTPILHKGLPVTFSLVMTKQIVGVRMLPGYFKTDGTHANSIKYVEVGMTQDGIYRPEYTATYPSDATDYRTFIGLPTEVSGEIDTIVYPMIRLAEFTDPSFEAYVNRDITITRTLPGIPVTSGGNYTDPDGQQWICDEVDLERGVYVQRIKSVVLSGSSSEGWTEYNSSASQGLSFVYWPPDGLNFFHSSICDKYRNVEGCWGEPYYGQYGIYSDHTIGAGRYFRPPNDSVNSLADWKAWLSANPIIIIYVLATPIETPLTAEEITAFKSLRTSYPNTTILNDAGAWMSVKYNADTKSYIENPRILKLTDSSTGVVYELKIVDGTLTVTTV